jgi:predicted subunit of tRNA(5-methylaminomethyl-2-thiouridylate) methyltransferase
MSSKNLLLRGAKDSILSANNILAEIEYDGSNVKLVEQRQGLVTAAHQAQQAAEELNRLIGMIDAIRK